MKRLSFSLKMFITVFVLCALSIIISTIAIDKQIDAYIDEIKTEIQIVNNSNDDIFISRDDDNKIVITVNPVDEETEEIPEPEIFEGKVISLSGLNIRQEPSVESERIGILEYGETVEILEDCGDWYRIDNGYIFKDYVMKN